MRIFEYSWQTASCLCILSTVAAQPRPFPVSRPASLATVLLEGLSHDRVVRALRLLHNTSKLKSLPSDWYTNLDPDAPLLKLGHWQVSLDKLAENSRETGFSPNLAPHSRPPVERRSGSGASWGGTAVWAGASHLAASTA